MRKKLLATLAATFAIAAVGLAPAASAETLTFVNSNGPLQEGDAIAATSGNFQFYLLGGKASCQSVGFKGEVHTNEEEVALVRNASYSFVKCIAGGSSPMNITNVASSEFVEFGAWGETELYFEFDMSMPLAGVNGCHYAGWLPGTWSPSESGSTTFHAEGSIPGGGGEGCPSELYGLGDFNLTDAQAGQVRLVTTP